MKVAVDQQTCTGCELCVQTCPDVFEMAGDTARAKVDEVPGDSEDCARQSIEECPVDAISEV
ncbi:ferredoxin [candidate division WOR-3 bacterium]|nr:ferredoxin [candidate division WOR-3 bacterium]